MPDALQAVSAARLQVALVGNPNTGKTTLFNRLTGLRAHTANYPGVTVDIRKGHWTTSNATVELVDLPGLYSLEAISPEETITRRALDGDLGNKPDAVVIVIDSTNLERNLFLASEIRDLKLPTIVVLNLIDAARAVGTKIDEEKLARELQCPVIPVSSKTGEGIDKLAIALAGIKTPTLPIIESDYTSCTVGCTGCSFATRYDWAERTADATVSQSDTEGWLASRLDKLTTHKLLGPLVFLTLMLGVFYLIFSLASVPMDMVDGFFGFGAELLAEWLPDERTNGGVWFAGIVATALGAFAGGYRLSRVPWSKVSTTLAIAVSVLIALLPAADFKSLLIDGIFGGLGGVVIFLPQICILFFMITLLEDSGYMARAAFVMERMMRFVGLPGKAFVPMLSAHACAIPGIMAARAIENWRDRLVTILVLPLLTCSARLPVYSMLAVLLFAGSPAKAAAVFTLAYALGIAAALFSAWALKKTLLKGEAQPMVLELPPYRRPSLRNALLTVVDRARVFLSKAGSVILLISVALWALGNYPKLPEESLDANVRSSLEALRAESATLTEEQSAEMLAEVDTILARESLAYSMLGRIGRFVDPVFRPLGFDWKINIGVMSSFAAREVIVSTLAIVYGIGEGGEEDEDTLVATLQRQTHEDGTPVFTMATCLSLLVFYVLAMQCLPTQAVTRRETGSWKWALFQLGYMTAMAYIAALVTYQVATRI